MLAITTCKQCTKIIVRLSAPNLIQLR
jgi:hypothetical protein